MTADCETSKKIRLETYNTFYTTVMLCQPPRVPYSMIFLKNPDVNETLGYFFFVTLFFD